MILNNNNQGAFLYIELLVAAKNRRIKKKLQLLYVTAPHLLYCYFRHKNTTSVSQFLNVSNNKKLKKYMHCLIVPRQ